MKNRAKSLLVVTSRFPFGSQEAYLGAELSELLRHFERVAVVPVRPPQGPARHSVPPGVEVLPWPLLDARIALRAALTLGLRPFASARVLSETFRSRDPGRLKNLAVAVKALALAHWARQNGYGHVHAYWMSTPSTVAMLAARLGGASWSAAAHRWDIYERNAFDVKQRSVAFVRAISDRGASDLRERMPLLNDRVIPLRLGIVVPSLAPSTPEWSKEFHLVCPAALVEVKGHTVLFSALDVLRRRGVPVRCTLYGSGPLLDSLRCSAIELGLERVVRFGGFIAQETLHDAYRTGRFAAVVLASRADGEKMMEGLPSALLEAMAFGVPVVATDSGSIGELLDGRSGHLVPAGDPARLADALYDVFINPEAARARARHAHAVVADRHDVRKQMHALAAAVQGKD